MPTPAKKTAAPTPPPASPPDARTGGNAGWQGLLVLVGFLLLVAAGILQALISHHTTTAAVSKVGDVTTTTTGPAAPPDSLVTTCLGAGVVLIVAGALFSRITKIVITGIGEIDVDAQAGIARAAVAAVGNDPDKVAAVVKQATKNLAVGSVRSGGRRGVSPVDPDLDPIRTAVDQAVTDLGFR